MFRVVLLIIAPNWKQPKGYPQVIGEIDCCIVTVEHYSAIKRNELWNAFATTWMSLKNGIQSGKARHKKYISCMIPFI